MRCIRTRAVAACFRTSASRRSAATHASTKSTGFAEGEQWWNTGSFVPFARTQAERESRGDPRPSIEERYPSHAAYIAAVTRVCKERGREGLMLQEDADRFVAAARQKNPLDASVQLGPLIQAGA